ncbi:hypothetical protein E4T66_18175 [Sinimarinibacterium sp. CAU 1509]|uniref:hypothetical protein n=1 Tax=Sinimarinibacterium sp. CAU 1509 TaxID=2562283 RepID=UPI0011337B80|nr:hypothetical protein [Sinimarinibacterium sp. CAU 1509]TJY57333.1 hypothetical protein E4T66_18175 [Sinimarinibacterium sp. CAU 1509]
MNACLNNSGSDYQSLLKAKASVDDLAQLLMQPANRLAGCSPPRLPLALWLIAGAVCITVYLVPFFATESLSQDWASCGILIGAFGVLGCFFAGLRASRREREFQEVCAEVRGAIRAVEATQNGGWLLRFRCFRSTPRSDSYIRSFDVATEFDPYAYLTAVWNVRASLADALAAAHALDAWRSEGPEHDAPPGGA